MLILICHFVMRNLVISSHTVLGLLYDKVRSEWFGARVFYMDLKCFAIKCNSLIIASISRRSDVCSSITSWTCWALFHRPIFSSNPPVSSHIRSLWTWRYLSSHREQSNLPLSESSIGQWFHRALDFDIEWVLPWRKS
jgi:hypothetical protein